jgi:hypothetical protein
VQIGCLDEAFWANRVLHEKGLAASSGAGVEDMLTGASTGQ